MLWSLGPLGAASLLACDIPAAVAWPAAALAVVMGWRAARIEARRPPVTVSFPVDAPPVVDGRHLVHARLQWRGPLAFLQWREGRRLRGLSWWPDTLPPAARRELRLATGGPLTAHDGGSVAP
ncbi:MAG TPA: hypothetical protein VFM73_04380 [Xanthomonadaceae bacterium]|nr:hypothetical protein [Xanthomonadaceae bacterium]